MNHEYDNCNYHKDEYNCDCRPCAICNLQAPEEYRTYIPMDTDRKKMVNVCDNCIDA